MIHMSKTMNGFEKMNSQMSDIVMAHQIMRFQTPFHLWIYRNRDILQDKNRRLVLRKNAVNVISMVMDAYYSRVIRMNVLVRIATVMIVELTINSMKQTENSEMRIIIKNIRNVNLNYLVINKKNSYR